jgi:hypothetical protein
VKHGSKGAERVYKALKHWGDFNIILEHHVGSRLKLDYYLPEFKLGYEVQGSQHDEFNAFFHDSKDAFKAQQARDERKEELCSEQGILYVALPYALIMKATSEEDLLKEILKRTEEARTATKSTDF